MASQWYYAVNGQQLGPVSADELRAAVRRGDAGPATLAWRDGLSDWRPLSELAAELQLELGATASAPPPLQAPSMPSAGQVSNPYSAPLTHGEAMYVRAGAGEVVYAGFWRRFAARFIDGIVLAIPTYLILFLVVGGVALTQAGEPGSGTSAAAVFIVYVLPMVFGFFYFTLMHSSSYQATLGKMAVGIKVTDMEGRRIGFGQAAGRWFATLLSYITVYIGFIMAGFTERKQALHDMVVQTLVVDKWAYTNTPERQRQGTSGCLVAFIVAVVAFVPIVAILAAISISQYQDYVERSQVSEGASLADGVKTAMAEYIQNKAALPASNADAGLAEPDQIRGMYVSYVDIGRTPGRIEIGFSSQPPNKASTTLNGKHLYYDAKPENGSVTWTCHSEDLKQKWCPASCSCSG